MRVRYFPRPVAGEQVMHWKHIKTAAPSRRGSAADFGSPYGIRTRVTGVRDFHTCSVYSHLSLCSATRVQSERHRSLRYGTLSKSILRVDLWGRPTASRQTGHNISIIKWCNQYSWVKYSRFTDWDTYSNEQVLLLFELGYATYYNISLILRFAYRSHCL